jgi:hypothetical protein
MQVVFDQAHEVGKRRFKAGEAAALAWADAERAIAAGAAHWRPGTDGECMMDSLRKVRI